MFSVLIYTGKKWKGSLCVWRIINKRPQASCVFSLSLCGSLPGAGGPDLPALPVFASLPWACGPALWGAFEHP